VSADPAAVLRQLVGRARPVILEGWAQHSCVASTRIGQQVLGAFGVHGEPTAVVVRVWNRAAWQAVRRGRVPDFEHTDAWVVGVAGTAGVDRSTRRWDGHLVFHVTDPAVRGLLDLAAGLFHRPERGIHTPAGGSFLPFTEAAEGRFLQGEPVFWGLPQGGTLSYRRVDDDTWAQAPDWLGLDGRFHEPVARLVRLIRHEL
jgi:hypothetical protein